MKLEGLSIISIQQTESSIEKNFTDVSESAENTDIDKQATYTQICKCFIFLQEHLNGGVESEG